MTNGALEHIEEAACTCGAGHGSHEGHLGWCLWLQFVSPLLSALFTCERYAHRVANNPDAHAFDRENAKGIIRIASTTRNALTDPGRPVPPHGSGP